MIGRIRDFGVVIREITRSGSYTVCRDAGLPYRFQPIILTPREAMVKPSILLDVALDGVIIFDRDCFLQGLLREIRRRLRQAGARRVKHGRGWYWILKPGIKRGGCGDMNTKRMAIDYIRIARRCLADAENAFSDGEYAYTSRRAQECIELSAKSVLRAVGIEFPKQHDVSDILEGLEVDMPKWFMREIPVIAGIMREITPKRGCLCTGLRASLNRQVRYLQSTTRKQSLQTPAGFTTPAKGSLNGGSGRR